MRDLICDVLVTVLEAVICEKSTNDKKLIENLKKKKDGLKKIFARISI